MVSFVNEPLKPKIKENISKTSLYSNFPIDYIYIANKHRRCSTLLLIKKYKLALLWGIRQLKWIKIHNTKCWLGCEHSIVGWIMLWVWLCFPKSWCRILTLISFGIRKHFRGIRVMMEGISVFIKRSHRGPFCTSIM